MIADSLRRANRILRKTAPARKPRPARFRRGRHAEPASGRAYFARGLVVGLGVLAATGGVGWVALDSDDGPAPASAVATVPVDEAEENYLFELNVALAVTGTQLTPAEQPVAVEIARKHVEHGHLIGMRVPILTDFERRIPRLTAEQRDIARVAVEHHFLAVTGRKQ